MKYSVITPYYNQKSELLQRCIKSVIACGNSAEHLLINDGSDKISSTYFYPNVRNFILPHGERVIAYNKGLSVAQGDWICFLDSDDYYLPHYFEVLDKAMEKYPEAQAFNFGAVFLWNDYNTTFKFTHQYEKGEIFKSGDIMSGAFVFKRSLLEGMELLPEATNCYDFGKKCKERWPELQTLYGEKCDLGNPWGQDFIFFWMITRMVRPQMLHTAPYVIDIRGDKKL
jgi:glycosyltransferase involved in cell wall biosynthesis